MIHYRKTFKPLPLAMVLSIFITQGGLLVWAAEEKTQEKKSVTTLKEVVVTAKSENPYKVKESSTASKVGMPLLDIPAAIIAIPRQLLEDRGALTMNEATKNVSGVTPTMGGGYGFADRYLIRGLAQRFLRDGLTDGPSMNGYWRNLWDVETLEVLKGPGSALYGRGEPGGTINLVTKKPVDTYQLEIGGSAGAFGTYDTYLDVGGAPVEGLPTRLVAGYEHTDGFRDLERDIWGVTPTVSWKPDASQTWTLDYDYRRIEIVPDNYGILFKNGQLIPVDRELKYYSPFNFTEQEIHRVTLQHEWSENEDFTLRNNFVYEGRDLSFVRNAIGSINAAGQFASRNAREQTDNADYLQYQIEAVRKFETGSWLHTLLAGFEYERANIDTVRSDITLANIVDPFNPVIPETDLSLLAKTRKFDKTVSSDTIAFYGQDMIELTEQWKVRGGIRYDNIWFSDDGFSNFPATASPYTQRSLDFEKGLWSWQAGVVYQPVTWMSFYGGASEGKFINIQTESVNLTEAPEESFQLETGIKADWWDGKLSTGVALYQTSRDNYFITPFGGGDSVPDGHQETTGVELDIVGNPFAGLTLAANLAVLDAEFTGDQLSGTTNIKGKDPQGVPERQASVWLQYEFQDARLKGLGFGIGTTYQGSLFADALNANKVPGDWVGDLAVFYKLNNYQEFRLSVKNFTDEEYFTNATFSGALPGEPLNVNVSYKARF